MNSRNNLLIISSFLVITACCTFTGLSGVLMYILISDPSMQVVPISEAERQAQEAQVLAIASSYANHGQLETASAELDALNIPNPNQYITLMLDRYIQENRSPDDAELKSLYKLAEGLGSATPAMAALFSTPTLEPTATPLPVDTATAVPTDSPTPTNTAQLMPTETPTLEPTETSTPEPTATETAIPPTATFAPPTNTPEPTATPEPPKPEFGFVVALQEMVRNPTYNQCPGAHQIYVTVVDAAGNPLDGVQVVDTGRAVPPHTSGEKGPGKLEYDLWNNGFSLLVLQDEMGAPATSQVTNKLSSWDEDIPNEWLVAANYCKDLNDCIQRKSGNQLCRGHYAYNVTFQKTY